MSVTGEIHDLSQDLENMEKKRRLEQVNLLSRQRLAPIQGRCIELGAGGAYFSQVISKLPQVTEVIALDLSREMIDTFREPYSKLTDPDFDKIQYVVDDMNTFGMKYGSFDTVIFCASFHHSPDHVQSLKQAWQILRPGGSLILHGEHYYPLFLAPKHRPGDYNTIPQFKQVLRKTGFKPIVYRFAFSGGNHPLLKQIVLTWWPICYLNGLLKYSCFMMLGRKIGKPPA